MYIIRNEQLTLEKIILVLLFYIDTISLCYTCKVAGLKILEKNNSNKSRNHTKSDYQWTNRPFDFTYRVVLILELPEINICTIFFFRFKFWKTSLIKTNKIYKVKNLRKEINSRLWTGANIQINNKRWRIFPFDIHEVFLKYVCEESCATIWCYQLLFFFLQVSSLLYWCYSIPVQWGCDCDSQE